MDQKVRTLVRQQCYIDGIWTGEPVLPVTNPATDQVIGRTPNFGEAETRAAIQGAHKAYWPWRIRLAKDRSRLMRRWFDLIQLNSEELARLITAEQGKPLAESLAEVAYGAAFVEFYAEEAKRIYGETIPTHRAGGRIIVAKEPIGVVAAITPWNFPLAMITRKVAPAIAAGCTVVVKPAPETPLTALALAALAEQAGLPRGVINVVTGDARKIGAELTSNRLVRMVAFTGSTEVGKLLMTQAARTVKKVSLELGGNAPFIVFDDADIDEAVNGAVTCKFRNAGQTCVCANRILVQSGIYNEFARKLTEKVRGMKVGGGAEEGVVIGPLINKEALDKVEAHVSDAIAKGAQALTGGKPSALGRTFYEPTVLSDATVAMRFAQEETFGPVAPLFRFETEEEALVLANGTPYGLAAYFYTRDVGRVWRVSEGLEFGIVGVNEGLISTETAPFGGVKESGLGREGARHGIEEFLEIKYVFMGGL
jgi:succinate-semialdehyde dehydrogenase / glutarate-semialdehyde dehydrogenase